MVTWILSFSLYLVIVYEHEPKRLLQSFFWEKISINHLTFDFNNIDIWSDIWRWDLNTKSAFGLSIEFCNQNLSLTNFFLIVFTLKRLVLISIIFYYRSCTVLTQRVQYFILLYYFHKSWVNFQNQWQIWKLLNLLKFGLDNKGESHLIPFKILIQFIFYLLSLLKLRLVFNLKNLN